MCKLLWRYIYKVILIIQGTVLTNDRTFYLQISLCRPSCPIYLPSLLIINCLFGAFFYYTHLILSEPVQLVDEIINLTISVLNLPKESVSLVAIFTPNSNRCLQLHPTTSRGGGIIFASELPTLQRLLNSLLLSIIQSPYPGEMSSQCYTTNDL
jgi:hypothetical protein